MIRVLLIDQDSLFQKAFARMVKDVPECQLVGVAETGVEAESLLRRYQPQIVFADAFLGTESGIDLCSHLKESYSNVLVYILSNWCNMNLIHRAVVSGFEEYLCKPLSRKKFGGIIRQHQGGRQEQNMEYAGDLFLAVERKNYKEAYDAVGRVVETIFREPDFAMRRKNLSTIASSLFQMISGMDPSQNDYYLRKYELSNKNLRSLTLTCCWLVQIVTEVFRQICVIRYPHMNRVLQYIEDNKKNEIPLSDLSAQAGISSGYLSRIFKKCYQISVVDYIHLRKIHMAKRYMASSEMNISDISFLLGYSEAGYFCKIFKKYEGTTPSAFSNKYIKNAI